MSIAIILLLEPFTVKKKIRTRGLLKVFADLVAGGSVWILKYLEFYTILMIYT